MMQHYPHLLHYYALLSSCSPVIFFFSHISPPLVCSFPELKNRESEQQGDGCGEGSIHFCAFLFFEECIAI